MSSAIIRQMIANEKLLVLLLLIPLSLSLTVWSGVLHDYNAYIKQWACVLSNRNPWGAGSGNAYGPLHLIFAPLLNWHMLAPKAVFAGASLAITALVLYTNTLGKKIDRSTVFVVLFLFPCSPIIIFFVYLYGSHDVIVAFLVIGAWLLRNKEMNVMAGLFLGIAALLKFYPLLFAGFFATDRDGALRARVLLAAAGVFIMGMGAAYVVWGGGALSPLAFGVERHAKMLSVFKPLQTLGLAAQDGYVPASIGRIIIPISNTLISANALIVVAVAALWTVHGWLAKLDWRITTMIGILLVFCLYKVGHVQFFIVWTACVALLATSTSDEMMKKMFYRCMPFVVFLNLFSLVYYISSFTYTGDNLWHVYLLNEWKIVRHTAGLIVGMLLGLYLLSLRDLWVKRWSFNPRIRF